MAILPGSRNHEIEANFPLQIRIIEHVAARFPHVRFLVACYKERHRERCRQMLADHGSSLPVELFVGRTSEIVEVAACAVMVSGSVSLEMLAREKPAVVLYRVRRISYPFVRMLVRLNSMTLPNLIARQQLLPEWCVVYRPERDVRAMSAVIEEWLANPLALARTAADSPSCARRS